MDLDNRLNVETISRMSDPKDQLWFPFLVLNYDRASPDLRAHMEKYVREGLEEMKKDNNGSLVDYLLLESGQLLKANVTGLYGARHWLEPSKFEELQSIASSVDDALVRHDLSVGINALESEIRCRYDLESNKQIMIASAVAAYKHLKAISTAVSVDERALSSYVPSGLNQQSNHTTMLARQVGKTQGMNMVSAQLGMDLVYHAARI
jgi:hypothetical protein